MKLTDIEIVCIAKDYMGTYRHEGHTYDDFNYAEYARAIEAAVLAAHPPAQDTPASFVVNHAEALELAQMKRHESNLARCYLDLAAPAQDPQDAKDAG